MQRAQKRQASDDFVHLCNNASYVVVRGCFHGSLEGSLIPHIAWLPLASAACMCI